MITATEILAELRALGSDSTRRTFIRHGAPSDPERNFGVKVGDLKTVLKRTKTDHRLALELWETQNSDARYLAGLMADADRVTFEELDRWAHSADWSMLSEYTVPWLAAESAHALRCGTTWIDSERESVASSGWCTLASAMVTLPEAAIDPARFTALLDRVAATLPSAPNRVRYAMNGFVAAAGTYDPRLRPHAEAVARALGPVHVDMGGTACRVPDALETIAKSADRAKKKRRVRC